MLPIRRKFVVTKHPSRRPDFLELGGIEYHDGKRICTHKKGMTPQKAAEIDARKDAKTRMRIFEYSNAFRKMIRKGLVFEKVGKRAKSMFNIRHGSPLPRHRGDLPPRLVGLITRGHIAIDEHGLGIMRTAVKFLEGYEILLLLNQN